MHRMRHITPSQAATRPEAREHRHPGDHQAIRRSVLH